MTLRQANMGDVDHLLGIFADPEAKPYYPGTKDAAKTGSWLRGTSIGLRSVDRLAEVHPESTQ